MKKLREIANVFHEVVALVLVITVAVLVVLVVLRCNHLGVSQVFKDVVETGVLYSGVEIARAIILSCILGALVIVSVSQAWINRLLTENKRLRRRCDRDATGSDDQTGDS